jgi:hypothetical protein
MDPLSRHSVPHDILFSRKADTYLYVGHEYNMSCSHRSFIEQVFYDPGIINQLRSRPNQDMIIVVVNNTITPKETYRDYKDFHNRRYEHTTVTDKDIKDYARIHGEVSSINSISDEKNLLLLTIK